MPEAGRDARPATIDAVLVANNGHGRGFDVLRLALSASIVLYHSFEVSYGPDFGGPRPTDRLYRLISANYLPMFFALSGFLVAGSYARTRSLTIFIAFRLLRIVPALATEILVSALLIGAFVTTLPLERYYSDPAFFRYFLNIAGVVQFYLPGVFTDNPNPGMVNKSLWTIPAELICYTVAAAAITIGLLERRRAFAFILAAATLALLAGYAALGLDWSQRWVFPPVLLLMCFLAGILLQLYREVVLLDWRLAALAALLMLVLPLHGAGMILAPLAVAYFTVFLGLRDGPLTRLAPKGDYSYGLYLYAYPIQQLLVAYLPQTREWYWNAALTLPIAFGVAFASWHIIEKPALLVKKHVPALSAWMQALVEGPMKARRR